MVPVVSARRDAPCKRSESEGNSLYSPRERFGLVCGHEQSDSCKGDSPNSVDHGFAAVPAKIGTVPSTHPPGRLEYNVSPESIFMDSTGKQRVAASQALRGLYEPVASELEEVEALLQRELSSDNPFVDRLAQHGARLGGKRLRPALVLLSAKACGGIRPEHLTLAAMVEVVHSANRGSTTTSWTRP